VIDNCWLVRPVAQHKDGDRWVHRNGGMDDDWHKKTGVPGEKRNPLCQFAHNKSRVETPGIEPGSPLCESHKTDLLRASLTKIGI